MKLHKNIRQALSYLLAVIMVITMSPAMLPATAFAASDPVGEPDPVEIPDPNTFKYLSIFSANSFRNMSHCFYGTSTTSMAVYYSPFVIGQEEAIISFTIYASQDCSLRIYKYDGNEMDYDPDNTTGTAIRPYYPEGKKFIFQSNNSVTYFGDIVGVQMSVNIEEDTNGRMQSYKYNMTEYEEAILSARAQEAEPIVEKPFYGMNDIPLSAYNTNTNTPFIRNWIYWDGFVDTGEAEYVKIPDGVYVIVVEPSDPMMSKYLTYLPFKVDRTLDVEENLSEFEFEIVVPYINDPVSMIDGSFGIVKSLSNELSF